MSYIVYWQPCFARHYVGGFFFGLFNGHGGQFAKPMHSVMQILFPPPIVYIYIYIYIYAFSRCFYPKRLTVHSGYTFFCQYMCSLGIEPTTFALPAQCSNHWATGTREHSLGENASICTAELIQDYFHEHQDSITCLLWASIAQSKHWDTDYHFIYHSKKISFVKMFFFQHFYNSAIHQLQLKLN